MVEVGFENIQARQTLFSDPDTMTEPNPVREGVGEGGFVVLRGDTPAGPGPRIAGYRNF